MSQVATSNFGDQQSFYLFRLLQSLRQSIRAIDQHSKKLAKNHSITTPQLLCLAEIESNHGVSMSELSRAVHLSPSTVKKMVDRLADKALILKSTNEKNKTRTSLSITTKGKNLLLDSPDPLQDILTEKFNALSESEQLATVKSLEKVVDMLNAKDIDAAPMLETGPLTVSSEVKEAFWHSHESQATSSENKQQPCIDIRKADERDISHIINFINSSTEWYRQLISKDDLNQHLVDEDWVRNNFEKRLFYVGVNADGVVVGVLTLQFFNTAAYLGYVYIDATHVGKGYGKGLLEFAKKIALERKMDSMVLIAHPKATWAIKAYQKFGFTLKHRDKQEILTWNHGALKEYYEDYFMLFEYTLD